MKAVQALQDKPKNKDRDIVTSGRFAFLWESGFARDFPVFFRGGMVGCLFFSGRICVVGASFFPFSGGLAFFSHPCFFFPGWKTHDLVGQLGRSHVFLTSLVPKAWLPPPKCKIPLGGTVWCTFFWQSSQPKRLDLN